MTLRKMIRRKNILKIAIDYFTAAGAGTQSKINLEALQSTQLDTGRIYRYLANIKITEPKNFNHKYLKKLKILKFLH